MEMVCASVCVCLCVLRLEGQHSDRGLKALSDIWVHLIRVNHMLRLTHFANAPDSRLRPIIMEIFLEDTWRRCGEEDKRGIGEQ